MSMGKKIDLTYQAGQIIAKILGSTNHAIQIGER